MISASAVTKRYPEGLEALRGVSFEITAGELVFFTGHSGAGKSTLFRLLAAIERPTSGSIVVGGQNLAALRRGAIPFLRRHFGLIFQDQKLLFDRSVLDNVLLPLAIVGLPHREALRDATVVSFCTGGIRCEKAAPWMRDVGLDNVLQLEGGILRYFEEVGGEGYDGACFVFDERIALDPALKPLRDEAVERA